MDIYDYLKLDHQKIDRLFKQYNKAPSLRRKLEIIQFLGQELLVHSKAEEMTFYKTLTQYPISKEAAHHGKEEHQDIEQKTKELLKLTQVKAFELNRKVKRLQELVEHHVHEEEGKVFRKAKRVLSDEEAWRLKELMHFQKQQLLLGNIFTLVHKKAA